MEEKNYYISSDTIDPVAESTVEIDKPQKKRTLSKTQVTAGAVFLIVLLICSTVYLFLDTIKIGAIEAFNQYQTQKQTVAAQIKQNFYDLGEQQHHVSNRISISLGDIQEQMKLEVLRVSEVTYETKEEVNGTIRQILSSKFPELFGPNTVSWLEVPGYGVFTVDLQSAEFVVDEIRHYVLIRVPLPELSGFTIDYKQVKSLAFEESGLFKGSAAAGEDLAKEQLQNAELEMRQNVKSNQELYKSACDSAEIILKTLVLQLNPKIPDLTVEVEFI